MQVWRDKYNFLVSDIWESSEGYRNNFCFYLEIFGILATLSVGITEVMSDYMLRGWELIYVNKIPDSQMKMRKHSKNANVSGSLMSHAVLRLSPITDYVH